MACLRLKPAAHAPLLGPSWRRVKPHTMLWHSLRSALRRMPPEFDSIHRKHLGETAPSRIDNLFVQHQPSHGSVHLSLLRETPVRRCRLHVGPPPLTGSSRSRWQVQSSKAIEKTRPGCLALLNGTPVPTSAKSIHWARQTRDPSWLRGVLGSKHSAFYNILTRHAWHSTAEKPPQIGSPRARHGAEQSFPFLVLQPHGATTRGITATLKGKRLRRKAALHSAKC